MADPFTEIVDWMSLRCPPTLRGELISILRQAKESGEESGPADLWRILAERLISAGEMDAARDALRRWQALAPADHPLLSVLGARPQEAAKPTATPPPTWSTPFPSQQKREDPTSRLVRVIDATYTFKKIPPAVARVLDKTVVSGWETLLDEHDVSSRVVLHEFQDGSYGPWAVTGVFTDFAGAAAVEVVVRSIQRQFMFAAREAARARKVLIGIALPSALALGIILGYIMGLR